MLIYSSSMINVPKTSFLNVPLLVALLITSFIHFLLIAEIKIDLSEIEKKHNELVITLIKPSHIQPLIPPVLVVPVQPIATADKKIDKSDAVTEIPVQKTDHGRRLANESKSKKRTKSRHQVAKTAPRTPKIQTKSDVAKTVLIEPKFEADPLTPAEHPVAPAIPEPMVETTSPETAIAAEQADLATPDVIEKTIALPEKNRKKNRKKSKKTTSRHSSGIKKSQTPLSLDDLAMQIAQVGEKFGNQSVLAMGEGRIKTLKSLDWHKVSARQYILDWQHKVERIGNLNYPEAARQKDFTARLVMEVGIRLDGSVHSIQIKKSSGTKALDEAEKNIVQMSAPFAALPQELAQELDVLVFQTVVQFSDESGMTTQ